MDTISREIFEVEIVLLHTLWVKRNVGRGTPTKYLSVFVIIVILTLNTTSQIWPVAFLCAFLGGTYGNQCAWNSV